MTSTSPVYSYPEGPGAEPRFEPVRLAVRRAPVSDGLVLLGASCPSTNAMYHALVERFGEVTVVLEPRLTRTSMISRRARKLGLPTTIGQVLFSTLVVPALRRRGAERVAAVLEEAKLDVSPIDQPVIRIPSVNSEEARTVLACLAPSVIVVSGTRIISRKTLDCVDATFINLHAGVAPQYRGVHGGYWALAEGRPELVGSTVHIVDQGIDTGPVLAQATFPVTSDDSFATYPYLHLVAGMPLLLDAVKPLLEGDPPEVVAPLSTEPSRLRSHPTLWGYITQRLRRHVS